MKEARSVDVGEALAKAASAPSLLVATDFDGTISDITREPTEARGRLDALAALSEISSYPHTFVAVLSGRTRESLRALTAPLASIFRVAEHGAFVEGPTGALLVDPISIPPSVLDQLVDIASDVARKFPGLRVERKESGVAVHLREVDEASRPLAAHALTSFRDLATSCGLSLLDGRSVLEAHVDHCSKARALNTCFHACGTNPFVLYAGDDTTDEGAISFAHHKGIGIYIASDERPRSNVEADLILHGPAAWTSFLEALAAELRKKISSRSGP